MANSGQEFTMAMPIPPSRSLSLFSKSWNRPIHRVQKARGAQGQVLILHSQQPIHKAPQREIGESVKLLLTNLSLFRTGGNQGFARNALQNVLQAGTAVTFSGDYVTFAVASNVNSMTVYDRAVEGETSLDVDAVIYLPMLAVVSKYLSIDLDESTRAEVLSDELHTALLKAEVSAEAAREILVTARSFLREHGFPNVSYTVENRFDMEDELWLVTARFILDVPLDRAMELDFDLAKRLVASHDELPYKFLVAIDAA